MERQHASDPRVSSPRRDYLFVYGLGRSGTTALVCVLNGHGQIAIGMERFKRVSAGKTTKLTPDMFTRERFFDFDDGWTNVTPDADPRWAKLYAALAKKFDRVRYVGDKLVAPRLAELRDAFPNVKVVCIVRDIFETAHSWQMRADEPNDRWPAQNGAQAAVPRWNAMLRAVLAAQTAHPQSVMTVEHGAFFGCEDRKPLRAVLDFLGLHMDNGLNDSWTSAHRTYRERICRKPRQLSADDRAFVEKLADWDLWRQVRDLATA